MTAIFRQAVTYFLNLGFYPGQLELGSRGLQRRRIWWDVSAYALLVLGLIGKQCIDLTRVPLQFAVANLKSGAFVASLIVGVALFPPFMHWFNKRRVKPSWEHVLWAFSFGFFVNLSANLSKLLLKL